MVLYTQADSAKVKHNGALVKLDTVGCRVFSVEKSSSGARSFIVTTPQHFWRRYVDMLPQHRHYYEIIREGQPCHLYFGEVSQLSAASPRTASCIQVHNSLVSCVEAKVQPPALKVALAMSSMHACLHSKAPQSGHACYSTSLTERFLCLQKKSKDLFVYHHACCCRTDNKLTCLCRPGVPEGAQPKAGWGCDGGRCAGACPAPAAGALPKSGPWS